MIVAMVLLAVFAFVLLAFGIYLISAAWADIVTYKVYGR